MFSANPRKDFFRVILPESFFIPEITSKYNRFLRQHQLPLDTIEEILAESIKGFNSPEFGFNLVSQMIGQDALRYESYQMPKESVQTVTQKTFQINFRHSDAYMTYFLMMEHFFKRFEFGRTEAREPFGTIILELISPVEQSINRIRFTKCHLVGIPALDLDYSLPSRDTSAFSCNFAYTEFSTGFETSTLELK